MGRGSDENTETLAPERLLYGRPLPRSERSSRWGPEQQLISPYQGPGNPVWLSGSTDVFWVEGEMGFVKRASVRDGSQRRIDVGDLEIGDLLSAGDLSNGDEYLAWRGRSSPDQSQIGFLDAGGTTITSAFPTGQIDPEVFGSGDRVYSVAIGEHGLENRTFTREGASDAVQIEIDDEWSPSEVLDSGQGRAGPQVLLGLSRKKDGSGGLALISLEEPYEVVRVPDALFSTVRRATLIPADADRPASVMARTRGGSIVYWGGDPERGFEAIAQAPGTTDFNYGFVRDDQARDHLVWIEAGETPLRRNLCVAHCSSGQITRETVAKNLPRLGQVEAVRGENGSIDISWCLEDDFRKTTIKSGSWRDGKITGEATLAESGRPIVVERLIPDRENGSLRAIIREQTRPSESDRRGMDRETFSHLFQRIRS